MISNLLRRSITVSAGAVVFSIAITPSMAAAPIAVKDDLGRIITLAQRPRRIISLAPSVTEILYAVGGSDRLIADTAYCDYPAAALKLPHVGGVTSANSEKILDLHPDLIIIASQTLPAGEADALQKRWQAPVYVTAAASYNGVMKNIQALGYLAGKPRPTKTCLDRMNLALRLAHKTAQGKPQPKVFVVVWESPLMTASGTSFIGDLIRQAGGRNVAETTPGAYPNYSAEKLLHDAPDLLLTGSEGEPSPVMQDITSPDDPRLQSLAATLKPARLNAPWSKIVPAARKRKICAIPADWTDRPGPRLALALVLLARTLHPQVPK